MCRNVDSKSTLKKRTTVWKKVGKIENLQRLHVMMTLIYFFLQKLTRGNDNWSLSEVMHAIVLLAHFHSLGSFVYGCGINAEIDHEGAHTFRPPSSLHGSLNNSRQSPNNSHQGTPNSVSLSSISYKILTILIIYLNSYLNYVG